MINTFCYLSSNFKKLLSQVKEKFPSIEDFEREFTDLGKSEQISRLHAMLAPHMLRRLKSDVMKEIPAKSEMIVRVDLRYFSFSSWIYCKINNLIVHCKNNTTVPFSHEIMKCSKRTTKTQPRCSMWSWS